MEMNYDAGYFLKMTQISQIENTIICKNWTKMPEMFSNV